MSAMSALHIHLDEGELRASLVRADAAVVSAATVPLATLSPGPGWCEQAPGDWTAALRRAAGGLDSAAATLGTLLLGGRARGLVLLDGEGEIIRPAFMAADARLATGAGGAFAWLRQSQPIAYKRVQLVLTPVAYLLWWLTGHADVDATEAAWLAATAANVSASVLPPARPRDAVRPVLDSRADELGLPRGIVAQIGP